MKLNPKTCPKCKGLIYGTTEIGGANLVRCATCGLFHTVKGQRESLKKQILGDRYINPLGCGASD